MNYGNGGLMAGMKRASLIAEKLKEKVNSGGQYELVDSEENFVLKRARLLISDYQKARTLKEMVLEEYAGSCIEEIIGSSPVANEYGEVIHREESIEMTFPHKTCKENILSDLKLIHGIGPVRERRLKAKGYNTIMDLNKHKTWGAQASSLMDAYESNPQRIMQKISQMKSASDPLALDLSDFFNEEDFAVLDIETMGMSNQPIILLGIALPLQNQARITIHQFLLKDIDQELAALQAFFEKLSERKILLTFNGKSFDVPYIERRLTFYGLQRRINLIHFDLLHFSRRAWGRQLLNCSLTNIEREVLGVNRVIDIPSALVPEFYQTYREKNNPGPLIPILEHNKQDLLSLLELFGKVSGELPRE